MEGMKRRQIPAFGNWDYCDEMPITQYFESAMQAGLIRGHFFGQEDDDATDLFKIPVKKQPTQHHHHHHNRRKVKKEGGEKHYHHHHHHHQHQVKKQGKVYDLTGQSPKIKQAKPPKAVDEDLYKIPPELLYQKPKRKRVLRNLWSGCLGLNCIA